MRYLSGFASLFAEVFKPFASAQARTADIKSLSNVRQIALGALMYMQDYDETYPLSAQKFPDLIYPYVKDKSVFRSPLAEEGERISYSMNPKLQNKSAAAVKNPAKTILIYEGKDGKPLFRYDGRTVLAFADGHAKLMTQEEMKGSTWELWPKHREAKPASPSSHKKRRLKNRSTAKKGH